MMHQRFLLYVSIVLVVVIAPVEQVECHQNMSSHDINVTSSSSSPNWLRHQPNHLVFVESTASTVVCNVYGGYPPPSIRIHLGSVDITRLFDDVDRRVKVTGVRGLRQVNSASEMCRKLRCTTRYLKKFHEIFQTFQHFLFETFLETFNVYQYVTENFSKHD